MTSPTADLAPWLTFARVAREGSFTAAARSLGVSKSVASAQVRALELRCGVRLLERTTRRVRLTQVGALLLEACADLERASRDLEAILEEHHHAPVGTLRVATTHDLAARFVIPTAAAVARQHPGVRVEVVADDLPADLVAGGFDLAVRLGVPKDGSFVMRRLAGFSERLVATPDLAGRLGAVTRPRELAGAPAVRHALLGQGETWTFHCAGEVDEVAVDIRGQANTGEGVRALLLAGLGIGNLPGYLVMDDLAAGRLVDVCPGWSWRSVTLYLLFPAARRAPRRVAIFVDALQERFAGGR